MQMMLSDKTQLDTKIRRHLFPVELLSQFGPIWQSRTRQMVQTMQKDAFNTVERETKMENWIILFAPWVK